MLKFIGIDADITDLSPINLRLFFSLKKFNIIHTTDQFFSMSRTAKLVSKILLPRVVLKFMEIQT